MTQIKFGILLGYFSALFFLTQNFSGPFALAAPASTPRKSVPLKIMLDPGHGGEDQGTAHNNVIEKNITLAVAQNVYELLLKDKKFEAFLTRKTDSFLSLEDRKAQAEKEKVDVFISIHVNSSPVANAKGTEFYFESQNATDEESLFLANRENDVKNAPEGKENKDAEKADLKNILTDLNRTTHMNLSSELSQKLLEAFQRELQIKTRAIRQAPFRVLSVTMPAGLIELGFATNPKEARWLKESTTQKKMAQAIYKALISYKEKLDKTPQ